MPYEILRLGMGTYKDLEEYGIYVGIPAKKIGERNRELKYEFTGDFLPFI